MTELEILKALEDCSNDRVVSCGGCPYRDLGSSSCLTTMQKDAAAIIKKQREKIDSLSVINRLHEQDIADRDEMLKQKVAVVYADFMRDYECMKEENEGIYKELAEQRAEIELLQNEIIKKNHALLSIRDIAKKVPQTISDHCFPANTWKAREGYEAVDALVEQIVEKARA